jgi:catechol 2,3-dioxygenase-like lactoylglutathione lyase family enzyme
MTIRLEHANVAVRDLDGMIRFLTTAFPDFRIRGEGAMLSGAHWVHVGNDDTYVALNQASRDAAEPWEPYGGAPGLNHLGYEVDDVEALRQRLRDAGYLESTVPNAHPHRRRVYFHDAEGNDWEFVEYASAERRLRNDYDLPDVPEPLAQNS